MPVLILNSFFGNTFTLYSVAGWLVARGLDLRRSAATSLRSFFSFTLIVFPASDKVTGKV